MAVTVFLFILLLGGVAGSGESNSIDDLVEKVKENCISAGKGDSICKNFAIQFRRETKGAPDCESAGPNSVRNTYSATIEALSPTSRDNKMLLWSGTGMGYKAKRPSSKDSIDKSATGVSVYGLHWTKDSSRSLTWKYSTEVNNSYCSTDCPYPLENLFWALASIQFAAQAKGEVEVYLTDKTGKPYAEQSFFRKYEVPNLHGDRKKVTKLTVKLYDSKYNNCDSANMKQLEAALKKNDISKENKNYFCDDKVGTSKLADTGNVSVTQYYDYWRPDGTYCDSCMKLPSVITIIIPILALLLKS